MPFPQVSDIQNSYQLVSPGCMFTLREPPVSVICLCNTLFGILLYTASNLYILTATGMTLAWYHLDFFKLLATVGEVLACIRLHFWIHWPHVHTDYWCCHPSCHCLLKPDKPLQGTVSKLNQSDMCSLERETQNELVGNENVGNGALWCTSLSTVLLGFYQLLFFFF